MREVASLLDMITNGQIRPNHVTVISLLGHLIVALAIINNRLDQAALLLVVFGLLDTVDGELARLQKITTPAGAFYDSVSDRVKETLVYMALSFWLVEYDTLAASVLAVAALGGSFIVSYLKSRGETLALASGAKLNNKREKLALASGVMRFEVRVFLLAVALFSGYIVEGLYIITVVTWLSAGIDFLRISKYLEKIKQ